MSISYTSFMNYLLESEILEGIVAQIVKKIQSFMEPKGSLPSSQKKTNGTC
jgi:hypothetical protein